MKLLVVIVNYRSAALTVDCLRALLPELPPDTAVVVTDNHSPDDSVPAIRTAIEDNQWSDRVRLMPLPKNGGFSYGNNAAIRDGLSSVDPADYLLLLNPDTLVRPGAVVELINFMDTHPAVGIAGSRLEDPDGTVQVSAFRFPSVAGEIERGARFGPVTKLLTRWVVSYPAPAAAAPADWVAGASMIVRRAVFESAGLMDESYFMYYEEVDFCRAAASAGWPTWYVPASRVVHLVGAVSGVSDGRKARKRRPAYWFESRRRYFHKNHGRVYLAGADLGYLLASATYRLRRFIQRKPDTDPPHLWRDSLRHSFSRP